MKGGKGTGSKDTPGIGFVNFDFEGEHTMDRPSAKKGAGKQGMKRQNTTDNKNNDEDR